MIDIATLTIAQAATASNAIDGHSVRWCKSIEIHAPASLSGTVTVRVAPQRPTETPVYRDMESGGAVIEMTAGQTLTINELGFGSLRVETDAAPGAGGEIYTVTAQEDPGM